MNPEPRDELARGIYQCMVDFALERIAQQLLSRKPDSVIGYVKNAIREQMAEIANHVVATQLNGILKEIDLRTVEANRQVAKAQEEADRIIRHAADDAASVDPIFARLKAAEMIIERTLPFPFNGGSHDQVIRSRGLVLSALAGMQNVGVVRPDQEIEQKKEKPR